VYIIYNMANKQIHELPELDPDQFEPGKDKFIVQKQSTSDLGTYSSSFTNMITKGSAELPGSTDWQWNFLKKPAVVVGYDYGPKIKYDYSTGSKNDFGPKTYNYLNVDVTRTVDGANSGVPATAQNFLCVACTRNANFSFWAPRNKIVISIPKAENRPWTAQGFGRSRNTSFGSAGLAGVLHNDSAFDGPIVESAFVVENISFPRDSKININSSAQPVYREAGKLHFTLETPKAAKLSFLVHGGLR